MGKRVFKTELDAVNNSLQSQVNNSISKNIVDAKGDIVTASAADTPIRLAVGTNEQRLVVDSATTSGLKYVADTTNYAVGAKGDLLVGTAADTVINLAVGTDGQVLTAASTTSTGLQWATPAGGGKVLQVVQASTTSTVATSSSSFGDTALSASITPSSTSSKVLVLLTQNTRIASITGSHNDIGGATRLMRGATVLLNQINGPSMYLGGLSPSGTEARHTITAAYLDSPATTSATTYKPQIKTNYTPTSYEAIEFQTLILMEVGA